MTMKATWVLMLGSTIARIKKDLQASLDLQGGAISMNTCLTWCQTVLSVIVGLVEKHENFVESKKQGSK